MQLMLAEFTGENIPLDVVKILVRGDYPEKLSVDALGLGSLYRKRFHKDKKFLVAVASNEKQLPSRIVGIIVYSLNNGKIRVDEKYFNCSKKERTEVENGFSGYFIKMREGKKYTGSPNQRRRPPKRRR